MKSNNIFFAIILLFAFTPRINSQNSSVNENWKDHLTDFNANFFDIQSQARAWFDANPDSSGTNLEENDYQEYLRWEWFWKNRVSSNNDNGNGSFQLAPNAYASLLSNQNVCTTQGTYNSNWQTLGPLTMPIETNTLVAPVSQPIEANGIISAITVDPNNLSIIYTGSNSGGLFKSIDGGRNWQNITDPAHLPCMGIQDIAIDPTNSNRIYIASGVYVRNQTGYGLGVFRSTDAGATWQYAGVPNYSR